MLKLFGFSLIILVYFHEINCGITVVPLRAKVTYYNKKYIETMTLQVRKYSRKSPYYVNLFGVAKKTMGNEVMADVLFYELLNNEYRPSFIEFHDRLCNMINNKLLSEAGLKSVCINCCPFTPGEHHFMNMTAGNTDYFNYKFPFNKGRIEYVLTDTKANETVGKAYVDFDFKQKINYKS